MKRLKRYQDFLGFLIEAFRSCLEVVHEVIEDTVLDPSGFSEIVKNDDGTINYITLWYNGGGSLDEVLEYGMKTDKKIFD